MKEKREGYQFGQGRYIGDLLRLIVFPGYRDIIAAIEIFLGPGLSADLRQMTDTDGLPTSLRRPRHDAATVIPLSELY